MKFILKILIFLFFSSCLTDNKHLEEEENDITQIKKTIVLPPLNKMRIKDISLLDESKFIPECQDSLTSVNYVDLKNLSEINGIEYFNYLEGKYYCNRTFSQNFKTYIFLLTEGGDCGSGLYLMNIKEDTLLASKILWMGCAWERGKGNTETIFKNDSILTIIHRGFTSEGVKDSISNYKIMETYKIAINGGFELLDKTENKWNEIISVERWYELMNN